MLRESFNLIADPQGQSCSNETFEEEPTSLPYSHFPVPFIRVSQTVKRFKPGTDEMVRRKSTAPRHTPSETSSRVVDTFTDLESRLGINANKSQVGESSEILQGNNLKNTGLEELPHPNQIFSGKKKQSIKRPPAAAGNDVNEHLLQLKRKQRLLDFSETKPVESLLVTKSHNSNGSFVGPPTPSVVLETTKQCFLTFGADTALSWTSSRVASLSSTGLAQEGNVLPSGGTPWEGLVASVQRQTVCAGRPQDVVTMRTDQKRKILSPALDSPFDHFLRLYRNSWYQSSEDDDDDNDDYNYDFNAAPFRGVRRSRPLAFNNDFHTFESNSLSQSSDGGDGDEIKSAYFLGAKDASGSSTPFTFRSDFNQLFASNAQHAIVQSSAKSSGDDFMGQRSSYVSASPSAMLIKDRALGFNERAADCSHESSFQAYEKNKSFVMEE